MSDTNGAESEDRRLTIILPDYLYLRVKADSEKSYGGRRDSKGAVIRRILDHHYYGKNIGIAIANDNQESAR